MSMHYIIHVGKNPYKLLLREVKLSSKTLEKLHETIENEKRNQPTIKLKRNPKIEELYTYMLTSNWITKKQMKEIVQDISHIGTIIRLRNYIKRKGNTIIIKTKTIKGIKHYKLEPNV